MTIKCLKFNIFAQNEKKIDNICTDAEKIDLYPIFFGYENPVFSGFSGSGSGSGTRFFRVFGFESGFGYEYPNIYPKPDIFRVPVYGYQVF